MVKSLPTLAQQSYAGWHSKCCRADYSRHEPSYMDSLLGSTSQGALKENFDNTSVKLSKEHADPQRRVDQIWIRIEIYLTVPHACVTTWPKTIYSLFPHVRHNRHYI